MLLDVRFLLEHLTSCAWAWTVEQCEQLLALLGLHEVEADQGRRHFRAPSGLMASLHSGAGGSPISFAFPFEIPVAVRSEPERLAQFVDLIAWPVKAILGEPTAFSDTAGGSRSWILPAARITVDGSGEDTVSLIISRPS